MQKLVDSLRQKGTIYKKIISISPKDLGIRNKIKIYKATDRNGYFWCIIEVSQKSRLLMKDVVKFQEINAKLVMFCGHNFKHKIIFLDAPICSKAKKAFQDNSWKIIDATL